MPDDEWASEEFKMRISEFIGVTKTCIENLNKEQEKICTRLEKLEKQESGTRVKVALIIGGIIVISQIVLNIVVPLILGALTT